MSGLGATLLGGLAHGGVYAVLGLGLVMIHRTTGIVHFAHGSFAVLGVYVALAVVELEGPGWVAVAVAILATTGAGVLAYRSVLARAHEVGANAVVLSSLGLLMLIEGSLATFVGADLRAPRDALRLSGPPLHIGAIFVPRADAAIIGVGVAAMACTGWLLNRTPWGLRLRAAAADPKAAETWSVDVVAVRAWAWALASGLAAVAGLLTASRTFVEPSVMFGPMMKAFAAAAIGGFDSLRGAALGAWGLGVLEALVGAYVSTTLQATVAYLALVIVVAIRPRGLVGGRPSQRL